MKRIGFNCGARHGTTIRDTRLFLAQRTELRTCGLARTSGAENRPEASEESDAQGLSRTIRRTMEGRWIYGKET